MLHLYLFKNLKMIKIDFSQFIWSCRKGMEVDEEFSFVKSKAKR